MKKKFLLFFILYFYVINAQAKDMRIISLAPATTEMLFALGLDKEIIAVSQFSDYPPQAINKPSVGTFSDPNVEMIIALKPDIIFCTGLEQMPVVNKLRQLNFKVQVSDPANFSELFSSIKKMGELTDKRQEAEVLVEKMRLAIDVIKRKVLQSHLEKQPKVYIEIWHSPLMTAGSGSFVDEIISIVGGINIAHDSFRPYVNFTSEQVIKGNPDHIVMAYMDKEDVTRIAAKRPGWGSISAIKNGKVYNDINSDLFLRPGPRLIDGLNEIYKKFYEQPN